MKEQQRGDIRAAGCVHVELEGGAAGRRASVERQRVKWRSHVERQLTAVRRVRVRVRVAGGCG